MYVQRARLCAVLFVPGWANDEAPSPPPRRASMRRAWPSILIPGPYGRASQYPVLLCIGSGVTGGSGLGRTGRTYEYIQIGSERCGMGGVRAIE